MPVRRYARRFHCELRWRFFQETQKAPGGVFISALRAASATVGFSVQQVVVTGGEDMFPRNLTHATTCWLATQTTQVTESATSFGQAPVTPKTVGVDVKLGKRSCCNRRGALRPS